MQKDQGDAMKRLKELPMSLAFAKNSIWKRRFQ